MMRKMNKNVYGIMMATMMAASVSVTACGGQKSTGETMVGFEAPGAEESQNEAGGQAGAMVGNGMVEEDSLAELSKSIGFSVPEVKNIPFEVTSTVYTNGWNEFAQVNTRGKARMKQCCSAKPEERMTFPVTTILIRM